MAYLSFGGYSHTAGLTRYTRLNNADLLRNIATPYITRVESIQERRSHDAADWAAVTAYAAQAAM